MSIMEDKITNRDGVAIRIIRFDDGSTLEMLADLEASEQDKIISAHQRNADAQPAVEFFLSGGGALHIQGFNGR